MDKAIDARPAHRKRIAIAAASALAAIVALLLLGGSLTTRRVRMAEDKLQIGTVVRGMFREFIPVTGTVQPIQTVYPDALEGGTVKTRYVEDGHMVRQGEPIVELSNPQLHMDAINREAQLLDQ
jgi:HlyD family secretion protein